MITLTCKAVRYYSPLDETAFFEWLERIKCIKRIEGRGDTLYLHVPSKRISQRNLQDLLGLFRRYKVPIAQLAPFENATNSRWFTPQLPKT